MAHKIEQVRADLTRDIEQLRADLGREIAQLRADLTRDIEALRLETRASIELLRRDIVIRLGGIVIASIAAGSTLRDAVLAPSLRRVQPSVMFSYARRTAASP